MDTTNPFNNLQKTRPFQRGKKFWLTSAAIVIACSAIILFFRYQVKETMTADQVARSLQIVWQETKWVDKKAKPGEVAIVPSITFRVKNTGQKPLQYVYFNGIFAFEESNEQLSDGFTPALKKKLPPGQVSEDIFIKSFYGYSASTKEAFIHNISQWKKIKVKIFARCQGSEYALLGIYPITQNIEGVQVINSPQITPTPETPR